MAADLILGIDPGLDGALALVELSGGGLVEIYDVPVLILKNKRELDRYTLARIIDSHCHEIAEAWIERVWARPGEREIQAFAFGAVYSALCQACCDSFLPLHEISPQAWKKAAGLPVGGDKDESRKAASIQWPASCGRWPAKKHHGRAEAALIAAHGRRQCMRAAA